MSSIAVSCVFGAKRDMVPLPWPKHQTLRCSQTCKPAGAVGVLGDDVAAEVDERLDGGGFLGRVEPRYRS